jgi:Fic family protein
VEVTPDLTASLAEIDALRAEVASQPLSPAERERVRRELIVEAIYHTNRIEGNLLTLPEVRAVVEAFWAEQDEDRPVLHEDRAAYESMST